MTYRVYFTQAHGSVQVEADNPEEARKIVRRGVKGWQVGRVEPAAPLTPASTDADFEAWLEAMEPVGEPEPTPAEVEEEALWLADTVGRIQQKAAQLQAQRAGRYVAKVIHLEQRPPAA